MGRTSKKFKHTISEILGRTFYPIMAISFIEKIFIVVGSLKMRATLSNF